MITHWICGSLHGDTAPVMFDVFMHQGVMTQFGVRRASTQAKNIPLLLGTPAHMFFLYRVPTWVGWRFVKTRRMGSQRQWWLLMASGSLKKIQIEILGLPWISPMILPIIVHWFFSDLTKWWHRFLYFSLNRYRNNAMDPRKLLAILAALQTIHLPSEDLANDFVPYWHLLKHIVFSWYISIYVAHPWPR